jgi:pyridinium-3,5-biscarboxylic acid mononucleotide sulfurtransferase
LSQSTHDRLRNYFEGLDGVAVAFSGGVDSSLLLSVAHEVLGERALAVICHAPAHTEREIAEALELAEQIGARRRLIVIDPFTDNEFAKNDRMRCYHCKKVIFGRIIAAAEEAGLPSVVEGSNLDDLRDYRPGMAAVQELGVRSPLIDLRIGKDAIRALAHERGLPVWNKPSAACLVSRIPYGTPLTEQRLRRVDAAEAALEALAIWPARARDHGDLVRIETDLAHLTALADPERRKRVVLAMKQVGYTFVTFDLQGYRTGAMNEALDGR